MYSLPKNVYRERKDLQAAFPDPYDNTSEGLTYFEWCDTEGRLRFPEYFGKADGPAPMSPFQRSMPMPADEHIRYVRPRTESRHHLRDPQRVPAIDGVESCHSA